MTIPRLDADRVKRIYIGRDQVCRCGCRGTYVSRGEPGFNRRLARMIRVCDAPAPDVEVEADPEYYNISYGNDRALTAYYD